MRNNKAWVGFDFDGTLAEYHGFSREGALGRPIPATVKLLQKHFYEGDRVKIFSARVTTDTENPDDAEMWRGRIEDWCHQHLGFAPEVTNVKDHHCRMLYDDRAVQVEINTGRILGDPSLIKPIPAQIADL